MKREELRPAHSSASVSMQVRQQRRSLETESGESVWLGAAWRQQEANNADAAHIAATGVASSSVLSSSKDQNCRGQKHKAWLFWIKYVLESRIDGRTGCFCCARIVAATRATYFLSSLSSIEVLPRCACCYIYSCIRVYTCVLINVFIGM